MLELEVVIVIFDFVDIQSVSPFGMCVWNGLGLFQGGKGSGQFCPGFVFRSMEHDRLYNIECLQKFFFYEWEAEAVRLAVTRGLTVSKIRSWVFLIFLHLVLKTERPHIGPNGFDVIQAFLLGAARAFGLPSPWNFFVFRPDTISAFFAFNDEIVRLGCAFCHIEFLINLNFLLGSILIQQTMRKISKNKLLHHFFARFFQMRRPEIANQQVIKPLRKYSHFMMDPP